MPWIFLDYFGRNRSSQWVTTEKNRKILPGQKSPLWLQKRRTAPIPTPVGAIAELSTIEIVIAKIITAVSALGKRLSKNLEFP
jgi:hypothetical protein